MKRYEYILLLSVCSVFLTLFFASVPFIGIYIDQLVNNHRFNNGVRGYHMLSNSLTYYLADENRPIAIAFATLYSLPFVFCLGIEVIRVRKMRIEIPSWIALINVSVLFFIIYFICFGYFAFFILPSSTKVINLFLPPTFAMGSSILFSVFIYNYVYEQYNPITPSKALFIRDRS